MPRTSNVSPSSATRKSLASWHHLYLTLQSWAHDGPTWRRKRASMQGLADNQCALCLKNIPVILTAKISAISFRHAL